MKRFASVGPAVAADPAPGLTACNQVRLRGRVSALPEERELPSGDVVLTWRVVIDRAAPRRPAPAGHRAVTVDTIDCVVWDARPRRSVRALLPGDVVEVLGSLRRRFWRSPGGASSRTEVEAHVVRRLARPVRGAGS